MNTEKDRNKIFFRINGIIQLIISFGFIYFHGDLLYGYNFTGTLYLVMIANWILIFNIFTGIVGLLLGLRTFKGKLKIWKGHILIISFLILGIALDFISTL